MKSVNGGGSSNPEYTYDANGRRIRKKIGSSITEYIYDAGGSVIAERKTTNGGSSWAWEKGYVFLGSAVVAQYEKVIGASGATTYFVHKDHLGSTRVLTKPDKTYSASDVYDFLPYGESATCTGSGATPNCFTGHERDAETSLDYMKARYYSPSYGRFLSSDPLLNSGRPWRPQSWNRYAYVLNNPLRFNDPTGLYEWGGSLGGRVSDDEVSEETRKRRAAFRASLAKAKDNLEAIKKKYGENSSQFKKAKTAIDAYGSERDGNKVYVGTVADTSQRTEGRTREKDSDGNIFVTFRHSTFEGAGTEAGLETFAGLVGHEGHHVFETTNGIPLGTYNSEYDAVFVQTLIGEANTPLGYRFFTLGSGAGERQVIYWNSSWTEADVATRRDAAIREVLEAPRSDGGYGLKPAPTP